MAIINKGGVKSPPNKIEFDIKDTEFLMRLIHTSSIQGNDLEQGYNTLLKIKALHMDLMSTKVNING